MALRYMLDTTTCVRVLKADATSTLAGRCNRHAEQLCISSIVLAELYFGAENSRRVAENLTGIEHFVARLSSVLNFDAAAAADAEANGEAPAVPAGEHTAETLFKR